MIRHVAVLSPIVVFLGNFTPVMAQVQLLTVSHTYIMGDNDSRNDARQVCFLEAKKKVLERAGTYIQANVVVKDFQLSERQIQSYSAAVLSVQTTSEVFSSQGSSNSVTCNVSASVDIADVRQRIAAIAQDRSIQDRINNQQDRIQQLEGQVRQLNHQLKSAQPLAAVDLRKERNVAIGSIAELESLKIAAIQRMELKEQNLRFIVKGMTKEEVRKIAGTPQKEGIQVFLYGRDKIIFDTFDTVERFEFHLGGMNFEAQMKALDERLEKKSKR
jgi:vacuolar-type H+-ATPase subunit I/STV1